MAPMAVTDQLQRPLRDLRISVTDRCNYRCHYCMPYDEYVWIERDAVLSFEEITRLAKVFVGLGVEKIRLTGGEPLVRRDLGELISQLTALSGLKDLSLTTNGSLLGDQAATLRQAGLNRINVSLDTLKPERFKELTRRGELSQVLDAIETAAAVGLNPVKINTVLMKGFNTDELLDLAEYGRAGGFEMRFIEYMDVGNANSWTPDRVLPKKFIQETIHGRYPIEEIGRSDDRAPSVDYRYKDGKGKLGIIGSLTEPFCSSCTRARVTADGRLVTCLFAESGFDLKAVLRQTTDDEAIVQAIRTAWEGRQDRYSEERWKTLKDGDYRGSKKIEMITLGG
jgi:cyclic pyranopterin phosphate synthase